jgi:hypothetical protein
MSFVVMSADCTNAYTNTPGPGQPTYAQIDDAYADWYRARHGKAADRSLVLPVLKASLEHPDAGALWEMYIYKILDDLDIVYTRRERSRYGTGSSTWESTNTGRSARYRSRRCSGSS